MAESATEVFSSRVGVEQWIEFLNPEATPPPVSRCNWLFSPKTENNKPDPVKPDRTEPVIDPGARDAPRNRQFEVCTELRTKYIE